MPRDTMRSDENYHQSLGNPEMSKRRLSAIAVLLLFGFASPAKSDDPAGPTNMLDFLEPGMFVGMQTIDGTTNIFLNVFSKEDYELAQKASGTGRNAKAATVFIRDYPEAKERLDVFLRELSEREPEASTDRVIAYPVTRTTFGTIVSVGTDYVLVRRAGKGNRRLVLARSTIAKIDLDAQPIRFYYSNRL